MRSIRCNVCGDDAELLRWLRRASAVEIKQARNRWFLYGAMGSRHLYGEGNDPMAAIRSAKVSYECGDGLTPAVSEGGPPDALRRADTSPVLGPAADLLAKIMGVLLLAGAMLGVWL